MSRLFNWGPIEEKVEVPVDKVADLEQLLLTSQVALYLSLSFFLHKTKRKTGVFTGKPSLSPLLSSLSLCPISSLQRRKIRSCQEGFNDERI